MRVTIPITIDGAKLTSTTVPEATPSAYAGGTTYALGATASVATTANGFDVYESLANSNTGHAPASSPTWWKKLGATFGVYSSGTTYAVGDRVIDTTTHTEYESAVAGAGNPLSDTTKWIKVGANNRFRMFDLTSNAQTTVPSPMVVEVTPGSRFDTLGLVGLFGDSLLIEILVSATVVRSITVDLLTRNTTGWYSYYTGAFYPRTKFAVFDLPPYSTAKLRLTISNASGNVSCGGVAMGMNTYIGATLQNSENDAQNFSTIKENAYGDTELTKRRAVPRITTPILYKADIQDVLLRIRDDANAVPCLYAGIDDTDSGFFAGLVMVGVYLIFKLTMDQPNTGMLQLQVKEI